MHQIVLFERGEVRVGGTDGACIVDDDIDAAEMGGGGMEGCFDVLFIADVANEWECLAACAFNVLSGRVNGTRQLMM
jgi:hypothetical protein